MAALSLIGCESTVYRSLACICFDLHVTFNIYGILYVVCFCFKIDFMDYCPFFSHYVIHRCITTIYLYLVLNVLGSYNFQVSPAGALLFLLQPKKSKQKNAVLDYLPS